MSGLKEKITQAKTRKEINGLLERSKSFTYASKSTRARWQREADKRLKELGLSTTYKKKQRKKTKNE